MSFKSISISLLFLGAFGGCAMMPYHEDFSCNKGVGIGTCSSVTENYDYAISQGRSSSGESHISGSYSNAIANKDDMLDKVIVIDDALRKGNKHE